MSLHIPINTYSDQRSSQEMNGALTGRLTLAEEGQEEDMPRLKDIKLTTIFERKRFTPSVSRGAG